MSDKHIKYRAELVRPLCTEVKITIIEQSHIMYEFGSSVFGVTFSYNGVELKSFMLPFRNGVNEYYLKGFDEGNSLTIPIEEYQGFKEAVEAYNKHFKVNKPGQLAAEKLPTFEKGPKGKKGKSGVACKEPWQLSRREKKFY